MAHVRAHVNLSRGAPVSLTRSFIYNFGSFDQRDTLPAARRSDGARTDQTTLSYIWQDNLPLSSGRMIRSRPVLWPGSWRVPISSCSRRQIMS